MKNSFFFEARLAHSSPVSSLPPLRHSRRRATSSSSLGSMPRHGSRGFLKPEGTPRASTLFPSARGPQGNPCTGAVQGGKTAARHLSLAHPRQGAAAAAGGAAGGGAAQGPIDAADPQTLGTRGGKGGEWKEKIGENASSVVFASAVLCPGLRRGCHAV